MGASQQFSLTSECFSVEDIARYIEKTPNTVRKWFLGAEGVRYLPRGSQQPFMLIPGSLVRERFKEFGFTEQELDRLFDFHKSRLEQASAARVSRPLTPRANSATSKTPIKRKGRPAAKRRKA